MLFQIEISTLVFIIIISMSKSTELQNESMNGENIVESPFDRIHRELNKSEDCLAFFNISKDNAACLVPFSKTFNDSITYCHEHSMNLLEVNSEFEKNLLFAESKKFFSSGGGTVLWINGKWSIDKSVWFLQPANEKFYLSEKISTPLSRFVGLDDYCLTVQSFISEKYEIAGIRCSNNCYFYCELDRNSEFFN